MNRSKQRTKIVSALVAVLALTAGCSGAKPAMNAEDQQVRDVKVYTVGGGALASGKIAPKEQVQVASKLPAKVAATYAEEGVKVEKGQILAELDSSDYQEQVRQAEAGLQAAEAKLADAKAGAREQEIRQLESSLEQNRVAYDLAQKNYERKKALFDSGALPQADLDKARQDLENAKSGYEQVKAKLDLAREGATVNTIAALQAEVNRQRAALDLARNTLNNTKIEAPISGIVASKNIHAGEMASPGVPLFTIVSMDEVVAEVSVPEDLVSRIKLDDTVAVRVQSLGDRSFTGTVYFISPVSDKNSNTFPVKIRIANPDGALRSGMVAELFFARTDSGQIEIPAGTVVQRDGKNYVFLVQGDRVKAVEVTGKAKDPNWFAAESGVKESDRLVIQPAANLQDGAKVRVSQGESK